jgi:hypothetical protein
MTALPAVPLIVALLGQATPPAFESPGEAAARLDLMKKSVASIVLRSTDGPSKAYRLRPEPVLRFTNTVGASRDGAVFVWVDEHDRPGAAVQVFTVRGGHWYQELSSLSTTALVAEAPGGLVWGPDRGGVELKPVPGAPRPAQTPEQRLVQMRALSREFTVEDNFQHKAWQPLRQLTKPFARYGKPGSDVIDGALFCYVLTTDPEVYLMLEARQGKDGPEWQYAFAPMTTYAARSSWKGREVWSLGYRWSGSLHPNDPFYVREHRPGE